MAVNKVIYGGNTIIDITDTTATASDVLNNKFFYAANGVKIQGTAVDGGGSTGNIYQDINGYVIFSNEGETGLDMNREVTISTSGAVTQALEAGKIYHFTGSLTSLTLTLESTDTLKHYHFDFTCGSTRPTLSLPSAVKLPDDFEIQSNYRYEIDILNNYGTVGTWAN